jgi:hypothetical protein
LTGGFITARSQKAERRNARIREQLQDFYSPLLGIREEIRAKSELRTKIHSAANAAWQKQVQLHNRLVPDEIKAKFDRVFDYSNEQLEEDLVPLYRKMLDLYLQNKWLAEASTLGFSYELIEFVEIWNRYYAESLPIEILREVAHTEGKLQPFYKDLQYNFDRLTKEPGDDGPALAWTTNSDGHLPTSPNSRLLHVRAEFVARAPWLPHPLCLVVFSGGGWCPKSALARLRRTPRPDAGPGLTSY